MNRYKLYVDNPKKHINDFWHGDEEIVEDYLKIVSDATSKLFDSIEKCWINISVISKACGIDYKHFKICEVTSSGNIVFLTVQESEDKMSMVKVFLDDTYFKDKTISKEYFYKVLDYDTKKTVLAEKVHMTNILVMLNSDQEQDFVDGRMVFNLPIKLLKEFNGQPDGFGNKYSDYYRDKKRKR